MKEQPVYLLQVLYYWQVDHLNRWRTCDWYTCSSRTAVILQFRKLQSGDVVDFVTWLHIHRNCFHIWSMLRPIMKMTNVLKTDLWWVRLTALVRRVWLKTLKSSLNEILALCQTHCRPVFSRLSKNNVILHTYHTRQLLPTGQYGLCFGYLVSGLIPLCYHKGQVTFSGPFLGVPSL